MRVLAVTALLSMIALSGCILDERTSTATLLIDFEGFNPIGTPDIFIDQKFDPAARPSSSAYADRDISHPDGYTVHDLLVQWEGAASLVFTYHEGIGYTVDEILGVAAEFVDGCHFWELSINEEASLTGVGQTIIADGDKVTLRYTDCETPAIPEAPPSAATLRFDFNGTAPNGTDNNATEDIFFDATVFPSAIQYNETTVAHPGNFTVHDLMVASSQASALEYSYFDGLGYSLDAVHGVRSDFNGTCIFWALSINGEAAETGLSQTLVLSGDEVAWTYTPC